MVQQNKTRGTRQLDKPNAWFILSLSVEKLLKDTRTEKTMTKVNNQDNIAREINQLKLRGVRAVGDDGSVCIEVKGSRSYTIKIAKALDDKFGSLQVSDGVQFGDLWINNYDKQIHDDVASVAIL